MNKKRQWPLRSLLLFLVLVCISFGIHAQEIKGYVKDLKTGEIISDAELVLTPGKQGTISNAEGMFYFAKLKAGKYTLTITHVGYYTYTKTIRVEKGEIKEVEILMEQEVKMLNEVVITEKIVDKLPYMRNEIPAIEIEQSISRDAAEFLRSTPNVSSIRKGGTNLDPVVRGFRYGQLNVQANRGLKIEGGCPNRMDPTSSHIEMEDIDEIEVIKGPYALRYGPSLGGVINLITARPVAYNDYEMHVRAMKGYESNWNGQKEHIRIYGGNQKVFYLFSGSNKEYGKYTDGNGNEINSEFRKFSYKGQLGFKPFENHMVLLSWDENRGRDVKYPALPMDERTDDTRLLQLDYEAKNISKTIKGITLKLYNADVTHVMDNKERPFSDTVAAVSAIDAINQGYRLEFNLKMGDSKMYIGSDYENISKDGTRTKNMIMQPTLPVKLEQLWNEALITNLGFFAEYHSNWIGMEWVLAARMDMNKGTSKEIVITHPMAGEIYRYAEDSIDSDFTNFSASLGIIRPLGENFELGLSLGRGVRSPDMVERYVTLLPAGYDRFDYLGDPQLKPEVNNQIDISLKFEDEKYGAFIINWFYAIVNDYITGKRLPPSVQKQLTADVLGVKQFYNAEKVTFNGFEFTYGTPSDLNWGLKFTSAITMATNSKAIQHVLNDQGDIVDEVEVEDDPLAEIPPMETNISLHYKFLDGKLVPSFSARIAAEQSNTSEAFYEESSPGFTVFDFNVSYEMNKIITFSGGVHNLLDEAYYEHLNRKIIGSKAYFYEPGRIFFVNMIFNL